MFNYFNYIKIVRKKNYVSVFDGDVCVNHGNRPVDHNFAERVHKSMTEERGYTAHEFRGETTYNH